MDSLDMGKQFMRTDVFILLPTPGFNSIEFNIMATHLEKCVS
jgi:hypothetical protein